MIDLSRQNPTERFAGLAELYARCRPSYPDEALSFLLRHWELGPQALVVDVGAGTGISSRLLAQRGVQVLGIEPNAEMRQQAEREEGPAGVTRLAYREGRAEATGLPEACADAVLAAQAFHWFESAAALAEFHRILRPGGWVALLWNERDERDAFTAAYGEVFRTVAGAAALESARSGAGEALLSCSLFEQSQRIVFSHQQVLDQAGLLGRAFSASYAPREPATAAAFAAALQDVFAHFARAGRVALCYQTALYLARRRVS